MNLNRIITFVIFLSLLFLSACSPAPAPAEPAPTSGAATVIIAEAPPETEQPAATATTAAAQLEIVESFSWIDQLGIYRVEILARNPFDYPVHITFEQAILHDSSGGTLATANFYLGDGMVMGGLGVILPGETIPASACFTCMGDNEDIFQSLGDTWADTLTFVLKVEQADPVAYSTDFDVTVSSFSSIGNNVYTMDGTVENTGDQSIRSAFVRVLLYDADGNYVGWGEASVFGNFNNDTGEFAKIEPGTKLQFTAFLSSSVTSDLEYEITVIGNGCFGLITECQEEFAKATPQN
jgi:hypothetical protein